MFLLALDFEYKLNFLLFGFLCCINKKLILQICTFGFILFLGKNKTLFHIYNIILFCFGKSVPQSCRLSDKIITYAEKLKLNKNNYIVVSFTN